MECEIINPSDGCSISGENVEALSLACTILGNGQYALKGPDGATVCPMLMFVDGNEWWKKTYGREIDKALDALESEVIAVLDTFKYFGKPGSINNIGERAKQISKALKEKAEKLPKAPVQVFNIGH